MENPFKDKHIDIGNKQELKKWCKLLRCLETDLVKAVIDIGPLANRVDDYLMLNRKKLNND
ncbi:MAG: DUF3606 domain-containing protein [Bacteroidia bacterium]